VEGFKNYLRDILRVGENVYMVGAKLGWFDPRLKNFINQFLQEAKRKNITFYHIFDHEVKAKGKNTLALLGSDYKFLPEKYATNSAIDVFGDYVVTFTGLKLYKIDDGVTLFVIKDKNLAESYRTWFNFMYDMCLPKK
jgi:hypothetical protein